MDELTEEELTCLRASARPWYKLPDSCTYDGHPLYLKLCTDTAKDNKTLVVLLTDIRSSVWLEYFGEWRAIHIRIKVSARETHKSTYTDLKEADAVTKLLQGFDDYTNAEAEQATLESKSESEAELILHLEGLSFRLRMDKVSPALQTRLLYDLFYLPLLGLARITEHDKQKDPASLQSAIDHEAKSSTMDVDPVLLSSMQRFSQATSGVAIKNRIQVCGLHAAVDKHAHAEPSTSKRAVSPAKKVSPKKAEKTTDTSEVNDVDGDKTIISSPEPIAPKRNAKGRVKSPSPAATRSPARNTRATAVQPDERNLPSRSPSPPLSVKSKGKGKARHIAESPEGEDSDATQPSENEAAAPSGTAEKENKDARRKSKGRSPTPPATRLKSPPRKPAPSKSEEEEPPVSASTRNTKEVTPPVPSSDLPTSPHAPVLKRPAPGQGRGGTVKRGKRPGLQWSNFG